MNKITEIMNEEMIKMVKALVERYKLNESEVINNVMNEKKRGRPRQEKRKKERGPRGRPPLEDKVKTSNVGEDLIARLIERAKRENIKGV